MQGGKSIMTPTDTASATTIMETHLVKTALVETPLVETPWGGRIIASAFVVLATGLSWVFVATAMIGQ